MIIGMIKRIRQDVGWQDKQQGPIRARGPDRSTHPNRQTTPSAVFACLIGQFS